MHTGNGSKMYVLLAVKIATILINKIDVKAGCIFLLFNDRVKKYIKTSGLEAFMVKENTYF